MTFVSRLSNHPIKVGGNDQKYVKLTYDVLSNNNTNLESIAIQISQLPVREQRKFFRLLLNYVDLTAMNARFGTQPTMRDLVDLCQRIMNVVNNYYEEQEKK